MDVLGLNDAEDSAWDDKDNESSATSHSHQYLSEEEEVPESWYEDHISLGPGSIRSSVEHQRDLEMGDLSSARLPHPHSPVSPVTPV